MQKIVLQDKRFMARALRLALRGRGRVHPNPHVGAVLVKRGRVIGEGAHLFFGGPHAEVNAIRRARGNPEGGTLYVTLEPCVHFGKTPPCTALILEMKIKKVVVAAKDPNPRVSGKGLRVLRRAGVEVLTGVMEQEALELNKDFNHWIRTKRPYVITKIAQSLDGKTAAAAGQPKWITGETSRKFTHRLRASCDAILVGVNTLLKDDPLLNVRWGNKKIQPARIVLDSRLRCRPGARIFSKKSGRVILAVTKKAPKKKFRLFRQKAEVLIVKEKNGQVDLKALLKILGQRRIVSILVEGGSTVLGSFFTEKLVQEAYFFIAPKIIGGKGAVVLKRTELVGLGEDWLIRGKL